MDTRKKKEKSCGLAALAALSSFLGYTNQYYEDSLSSKNVAVVGLLLEAEERREKNLIETFFFLLSFFFLLPSSSFDG